MKNFEDYLDTIEVIENRKKLKSIFDFIEETFPELEQKLKWNQPMYIMDGTFIIGFSVSKYHIAIAPERPTLEKFEDDILNSGYSKAKEIIRIPWAADINYKLIEDMIVCNMEEKQGYEKFWR